jgi:hypothetical protein
LEHVTGVGVAVGVGGLVGEGVVVGVGGMGVGVVVGVDVAVGVGGVVAVRVGGIVGVGGVGCIVGVGGPLGEGAIVGVGGMAVGVNMAVGVASGPAWLANPRKVVRQNARATARKVRTVELGWMYRADILEPSATDPHMDGSHFAVSQVRCRLKPS